MTAHSSSTPHPQKQTSHSASFPCVYHGPRDFWVERLPPGRGEHGSGSTRDVPPRLESSRHVPPCRRSSIEVLPRCRSSIEVPPHRRCSRLVDRAMEAAEMSRRATNAAEMSSRVAAARENVSRAGEDSYRRMRALIHRQVDQISRWARLQDDLQDSFE